MTTPLHELIIYFLSASAGGFFLGFIFLGYFNLTKSHMYITVVGSLAFWLNLITTAYFITDTDITRSFPGLTVYMIMYTAFVGLGFLGRKFRLYIRRKYFKRKNNEQVSTLRKILLLYNEGGDRTDEQGNVRDSDSGTDRSS